METARCADVEEDVGGLVHVDGTCSGGVDEEKVGVQVGVQGLRAAFLKAEANWPNRILERPLSPASSTRPCPTPVDL